jgi:FkbM family methyltransferase
VRARARYQLHRAADWAVRELGNRPEVDKWQRERFYRAAGRLVPAICVEDQHGNRYLVPPGDPWIGRGLLLDGGFGIGQVRAAQSVLHSRGIQIDHLLDVGANIGTTTIEWLSRLDVSRATAFEPEPANFGWLSHNILLNGLQGRVALHQVALADREGVVTLELSPDNPGDHRVRLSDHPGAMAEEHRRTVTVPVAPLDTFDIPLLGSTFLCMDVQGHEGHVLDGAAALLEHQPPLMCEFWPYGLERAGGLDRMLSHLAAYRNLFDVSDAALRVTHRELEHCARDAVSDPHKVWELLALA